MRIRLKDISDDYKFNYEDFVEFALSGINPNIYCIIKIGDEWTTSTWYSDKLIDAYKTRF